jgi:hypothetical protein
MSKVGIAMSYGLHGRDSILGRGTVFLFSPASSQALGRAHQPPIQWVLRAISASGMAAGELYCPQGQVYLYIS